MVKAVDKGTESEASIRSAFLELGKALDKQDLHPEDRLLLRGMLEARMLLEIDILDRRKKTAANYKKHMKCYGR